MLNFFFTKFASKKRQFIEKSILNYMIINNIQDIKCLVAFLHKRFSFIKKIICLFFCFFCIASLPADAQIRQRIKAIKNADPLVISGNVGASMGISHNNTSTYYSTPFSYSLFGSFNFNIYGFNLPLSFYFVNNSTNFSYPKMPSISLGMTPSWKRWRFHIGTSSMHLSNYTYSGLTFIGAGAEYQGNIFRAAAFGGIINRKTNLKAYDDRNAFERLSDSLLGLNIPEATIPQYRRWGGGVKIGIGNSTNYIDLTFFKAKDQVSTLPEEWRDTIKAQENVALGLSGRFAIRNWFSFTANLGVSFYTPDMDDSLINITEKANNIARNMEWLYGVRGSSIARFAGDAAMNFSTKIFNGSITYRFIQPDYVTLGTSTFSQNTHSIGANTNFRLFKGKSNLTLVGYLQRDNLNKKQMYTNQVATYTLNWNNSISDNFNLSMMYNGIKQDQYNGTCIVPDSIKLNRITHTVTFSPAYTFFKNNEHTISLDFNFIQNKNLNKLYYTSAGDVMTISGGASYSIMITAIRLSVNAGYDFTLSKSEGYSYNAHTLHYGLNYNIMSKDKLNWSAYYNGSLGYNISKSEGIDNNISVSNCIGSSFNYNSAHTASLYLSLSNYSENIVIGQKIATALDCRFTLSYAYSFNKVAIKKKTDGDSKKEERINKKLDKIFAKQQAKQAKQAKNN